MQTWYNAFKCFLVNLMKSECQRKEHKVATWNCPMQSYNRNSHMHNYNRNSHVHNALQKIIWRKMWSFQNCGEKTNKVVHYGCSSYIFTKIISIVRNILPWYVKEIVHVFFCVFKTNLNKVVNIFCTQSEWIGNAQMIQKF